MDAAPGRSASFTDGALKVREPQFQTAQGGLLGKYRRTSILDSLRPSGNGMSQTDSERHMYGMGSAIGASSDTNDKALWIKDEKQAQTRKQQTKTEG